MFQSVLEELHTCRVTRLLKDSSYITFLILYYITLLWFSEFSLATVTVFEMISLKHSTHSLISATQSFPGALTNSAKNSLLVALCMEFYYVLN